MGPLGEAEFELHSLDIFQSSVYQAHLGVGVTPSWGFMVWWRRQATAMWCYGGAWATGWRWGQDKGGVPKCLGPASYWGKGVRAGGTLLGWVLRLNRRHAGLK